MMSLSFKPSDCPFCAFNVRALLRSGGLCMSSNVLYRTNAEDCLRMAQTVENDRDKSFWLNLAQSWLQLAERSAWSDKSRRLRESSDA